MSDPTSDFEATRQRGPFGGAHGRHGFDPNQPRVPAGDPDGGQWTDKPGGAAPRREAIVDRTGQEPWGSFVNTYRSDGTLAEQRVFNRDGSRIVSRFNAFPAPWDERHTVVASDRSEIVFENTGDIQRVFDGDRRPISAAVWEEGGPDGLPNAQLAFLGPAVGVAAGTAAGRIAVQKAVEAALLLFTWWSSRNRPDRTAVISFPADVYVRGTAENADESGATKKAPPVWVGRLTEKELADVCKEYANVQKFTNKAATGAWRERNDWSPQGFGTEVHIRVAREVTGHWKTPPYDFRPLNEPENPDFRAEFSVVKAKAADPNVLEAHATDPNVLKGEAMDRSARPPRYGQRGTIRIDVLENRPEKTVCVYDIKTGEAILSVARIKEIVGSTFKHYPDVDKIIITEVRPRL